MKIDDIAAAQGDLEWLAYHGDLEAVARELRRRRRKAEEHGAGIMQQPQYWLLGVTRNGGRLWEGPWDSKRRGISAMEMTLWPAKRVISGFTEVAMETRGG